MNRTERTTSAHKAGPESAKTRIAAIIALLVAGVASTAAADSIRLHDRIGVRSETIKLAQVAELTGDDATRLGDTVVGRFENDAETVTVTLHHVRDALKDQRVNWGLMTLRGYQRCRVSRLEPVNEPKPEASDGDAATANVDQPLNKDNKLTLRAEIEAVIQRLAEVPREDLRIEFRDHDRDRLARSTLKARYEIAPGAASAIGRLPLTVRRYEAGRPVETFTITADVQKHGKALVLTQPLSRGDRFTADSVKVRELLLTDDREPLSDPELVIGQQVASAMDSGSLVYPDDVRSPELVKRGELVTVRCVSGALVVRTVARAAADGAMGETIKLRNESSHDTFHARVTGEREAVVQLGAHEQPPMAARHGGQR